MHSRAWPTAEPVRPGAGARDRPRGPQRRAGPAAGAGHRPLQESQRHPRPQRRRPGASAPWPMRCIDSVRPMDLVARCRRRRVRHHPAQLRQQPSARRWPSACAPGVRAHAGGNVAPGRARSAAPSASAGLLRRNGCVQHTGRCGASVPTSSSTVPSSMAATWCGWSPCRRCRWSATEERACCSKQLSVPGLRMSSDCEPPRRTAPTAGRIVAVTSGKGGVGKTFVSANLAAALARQWPARAGAGRRPRPGQPRRGAEPVPQDHAARRVHRQEHSLADAILPAPAASRCCWPARAWSSTRA